MRLREMIAGRKDPCMRDIVGYVADSAIYHPECLPGGIDPNGEGVGVICNWEDDAFSTCDVCHEPLIEREALPLSHGLVILCDPQAVKELTKRLENCFSDDDEHDVEQIDDGISHIEEQGFLMLRWNDRI